MVFDVKEWSLKQITFKIWQHLHDYSYNQWNQLTIKGDGT